MSYPNPSVNRKNRKRILTKRVKALSRLILTPMDKRAVRLEHYKSELQGVNI